jgi:hypothetical protein
MARIAIDITPAQLQRVQALVESGAYASVQQFGEIAFANQLALEDGADPDALAEAARVRRGGAERPPKESKRKVPPLPPRADKSRPSSEASGARVQTATTSSPPPTFEAVVALLGLAHLGAAAAAAAPAFSSPPEQRVLPLINKPFGLKLVARAVLAAAGDHWPGAAAVATTLGLEAAVLGDELRKEDQVAERSRNLLNTGMPTVETEESMARFADQYLGRVARAGHVTPGAIVQFALGALSEGAVALTEAGLAFARMPNPVLDGGVRPWERVLSGPEQQFLVRHLLEHVPGEARDAQAVVAAVAAGENRPESLLVAVKPSLPPAWTDVQARSYLSGLVTRLSELDVLNRVWTGRQVHYELATYAPALLHGGTVREVA